MIKEEWYDKKFIDECFASEKSTQFKIRCLVDGVEGNLDQKGLIHFMGYEYTRDGFVHLDLKNYVDKDEMIALIEGYGIEVTESSKRFYDLMIDLHQ